MKLYQIEYEIQNVADLETRLSKAFGEPEKTEQGTVFENEISWIFNKKYVYKDSQEKLIEQCFASPIYSICTIVLGGVIFLQAISSSGDSPLISMTLSILYLVSGLTLFLLPILLSNVNTNALFPDESLQKVFPTSMILPVAFRHRFSLSPVVYLNGLFTLILAAPLIMPELSMTVVPVLILLTVALPLSARSRKNPATDQVLILAVMSTWPFGVTLGSLHIHSQRSSFLEQERSFIMWAENLHFFTDEMGDTLRALIETPMILTVTSSLLMILMIWYLAPKVIRSFIDNEGVYTTLPLISDQLFLRFSVCLVLATYIVSPLLILTSYSFGFHIIHFESITEILSIYWVLIAIVPLSVIGWIHNNYQRKKHFQELVQSHEPPLLHVEGVPVVTADISGSAAFITQKIEGQHYIIINQELEDPLNRKELLAICYHELYHLESKAHRLQKMSELPIVGYLLFFVFVNPVSIYEEECRADEYAARNVGREAIVSALEETESMGIGSSKSPVKQFIDKGGRWVAFKLFWKVPILSIYRPKLRVRINQLQRSI